ncbi:MAG: Dabb family protein [Bacteroidales bacterium]|nr:Dabb family protein [Bacteroidales bacterium]
MIKHVVLWKLDGSYPEKEKKSILKEMRSRLMALDRSITLIQHLEVYLNDQDASETNFDIMLDTVFNSLQDLETYQVHPDHLKVGEYLKGLKLQRSAIDFTF